jgi:hypothetical protein
MKRSSVFSSFMRFCETNPIWILVSWTYRIEGRNSSAFATSVLSVNVSGNGQALVRAGSADTRSKARTGAQGCTYEVGQAKEKELLNRNLSQRK